MTLTPYMILILAAFAVFIGVLGGVSIWTKAGPQRSARASPAPAPGAGPDGREPSVS